MWPTFNHLWSKSSGVQAHGVVCYCPSLTHWTRQICPASPTSAFSSSQALSRRLAYQRPLFLSSKLSSPTLDFLSRGPQYVSAVQLQPSSTSEYPLRELLASDGATLPSEAHWLCFSYSLGKFSWPCCWRMFVSRTVYCSCSSQWLDSNSIESAMTKLIFCDLRAWKCGCG